FFCSTAISLLHRGADHIWTSAAPSTKQTNQKIKKSKNQKIKKGRVDKRSAVHQTKQTKQTKNQKIKKGRVDKRSAVHQTTSQPKAPQKTQPPQHAHRYLNP
ncbi:hypothetical protein, partial [Thiohalocapsa marina]|uniref:hypothetical protein n=1 Tax=Thiohalocapsa marina TaxID=424902 RepID=UPI001B8841B7